MSVNAPKSLVFVHGGYFQPPREELVSIWRDALRRGIERDYPDQAAAFEAANITMAYFGDLTNELLAAQKTEYDEALDIADRRNALTLLSGITKRKKFKRYEYQQLPGKTAVKEALADVGSPVLGKLGLEKPVIEKLAPELADYWNPHSDYGQAARDRLRTLLADTLAGPGEVMIVAHCVGSIFAYDVLWELSQSHKEQKADMLLTLGSPLGNKTIQKKLAGHSEDKKQRYPANILIWNNIAAEDDYVCHDKTVADDFHGMLKQHLISSINDYRIYNLAVHYGKSDPHSSLGYLVHPRVAKLTAEWL